MHLVIIGNGIAGVTTARYVRKSSDAQITIISSESKYFFSRTALMYVYMGHMRWGDLKPYEDWFWKKNNIELVRAHVVSLDTDSHVLGLDNNETISYDKLVIATGSHTNKLGLEGEELDGAQGLYSRQDLELLEANSRDVKSAVIVGGGLIGIELAEMLHSRGIHVTFLVREKLYWNSHLPDEEAALVSRHIIEHDMNLKLQVELRKILPDDKGRVRAVVTSENEEIPCRLVGLTPGVHPNTDLVKKTRIETGKGILVNRYLETNVPDVYAAGDCAEIKRGASDKEGTVEQLWYTGRMQGKSLARNILGERIEYNRGVWYNSAKFLNIEYQSYGVVSPTARQGEESFYWEHPSGKTCLRLVYSASDRGLIGINVFGMRLRHRLFEAWINEGKRVEYVLTHLTSAVFDSEFSTRHNKEIIDKFNHENPATALTLNKNEPIDLSRSRGKR